LTSTITFIVGLRGGCLRKRVIAAESALRFPLVEPSALRSTAMGTNFFVGLLREGDPTRGF
jgi:hypothetical protein